MGSWFECALLFSGCAHMSPVYQNPTTGPARSVLTEEGYSLAFIEFGEQGSYQDTSQVEKAVELVRTTKKPVVITYVHGWHNNADSSDVPRFTFSVGDRTHSAHSRRGLSRRLRLFGLAR